MIYVGIGGWTFEPWRGTFYPKGICDQYPAAQRSNAVVGSAGGCTG